MALDPYDTCVWDAVERVIVNAKIPVSGDVDARLQALQPAIVDAIANTAALDVGHSYFVRVYAELGPRHRHVAAKPVPPYWTWHVVVQDENDEQVWCGEGFIEG